MSTIQEKYQQSQLADAAYANFSNQDIAKALQIEGFSESQAATFASQYRVVDQIPDTGNGFSATVFEKLDVNGVGTGQYIFAPRGTNDSVDLVQADLKGIAIKGGSLTFNFSHPTSTKARKSYKAKR